MKASDEDLAALYPDLDLADAARRLLALRPAGGRRHAGRRRRHLVRPAGRRRDRVGPGDGGRHDRRRRHVRRRPDRRALGRAACSARTVATRLRPDEAEVVEVLAHAARAAAVTVSRPGADPPYRPSSTDPRWRVRMARRVRIRIDLAYDGADFHGWAAQPGLRTVQGDARDGAGHGAAAARGRRGLRRPHRHRRPRPRPGGAPRRRREALTRPPGAPRTRRPRRCCAASTASCPPDVRVRRVVAGAGRVRRPLLGAVAALRLPDRRRPGAGRPADAAATCWPGRGRSTSTR